MNNKLITYTLPRPFSHFSIPISIQSLALRDYCQKNSLIFTLPQTENLRINDYTVFMKILKNNNNREYHIGLVSYFVLPIMNLDIIKKIFFRYRNHEIIIHSILENKVLNIKSFLEWSSDISLLRECTIDYTNEYLNEIISNI